MSTFTWRFPAQTVTRPVAPPTSTAASTDPADALFGGIDMDLDPVTRDYINTDDGAWAETTSSRAAVMMQLEIQYNRWHADPDAGSRIRELLEADDEVTADMIVDEARRSLQLLVEDGIVADLSVAVGAEDTEAGRLDIDISYTDVLSGHVVELNYSPA